MFTGTASLGDQAGFAFQQPALFQLDAGSTVNSHAWLPRGPDACLDLVSITFDRVLAVWQATESKG